MTPRQSFAVAAWVDHLSVRVPEHHNRMMSGTSMIETERLRLRPRTMADLGENLAMDLDPAVHRFIFVDGAPSRAAHHRRLEAQIRSDWPDIGGCWVVELREDPGFLGWCGLFPLETSGLIEIGYRLARRAWGRGIATEAARAVRDRGFEGLGFERIVAVSHPENAASHRVLGKIGFERRDDAFHYGRILPFFSLDHAGYRAQRRREASAPPAHVSGP